MQISSCYSLLQSLHWLPTATWSKPYNIEGPFQTILLKSGTSSPWHIHICFPLHLSPSEMYIFYLCALCQSLPFKGNNTREEMSVFCLLLYHQCPAWCPSCCPALGRCPVNPKDGGWGLPRLRGGASEPMDMHT